MAPVDVVALARELIDIDSTTGRETAAGRFLASRLRSLGFAVEEQPVDGDRVNIFASRSRPIAVFSTHYDCVPPFIPSSVADGNLFGRGSSDAKGILAAQITAAEQLHAEGEHRIGLLFVVGEERGSDGARAAGLRPPGSRFLVNGEPTDNRLGSATRGILRIRVSAEGRAAHSAYPERGVSAIDKLVDAIVALRAIELPEDPVLGPTTYSVGTIAGGVAPNVIPAAAEAEIMFRIVGDPADLRSRLEPLEQFVTIETVLELPPVRLEAIGGFPSAAFSFTTDLPLLRSWGAPLLLGPGSIHVAHTDGEHVAIADLEEGVRLYVRLARRLLAG